MWSCEVVSTRKDDTGVVYATLRFTHTEGKTFQEEYRNVGEPDPEWIPRTAKARILQLNGADSAVIAVGPVAEPKADFFAEYRMKYQKAKTLKVLIDLGALTADDKRYVDLVAYLRDNLDSVIDKM